MIFHLEELPICVFLDAATYVGTFGAEKAFDNSWPEVSVGCRGNCCAMWKWHDHDFELGYCGLSGKPSDEDIRLIDLKKAEWIKEAGKESA